jgi:hypothetical protein
VAASVRVVEVDSASDLDNAIRAWIAQGYVLANKSSASATMIKRKEFSTLWAVIGFLVCVIPLLIYCIVYAASSDHVVEIRLRDTSGSDPTAELERLQKLVEQGDMSPVEFDIAKQRILGGGGPDFYRQQRGPLG